MKNKIWMTFVALFCLGVSLLIGGCAAAQPSQRTGLQPLVGGPGGAYGVQGGRQNFWPHPNVMP